MVSACAQDVLAALVDKGLSLLDAPRASPPVSTEVGSTTAKQLYSTRQPPNGGPLPLRCAGAGILSWWQRELCGRCTYGWLHLPRKRCVETGNERLIAKA